VARAGDEPDLEEPFGPTRITPSTGLSVARNVFDFLTASRP